MLIRAYLPKFITALFGGLFVALGIVTFGDAAIFDRIFICVLVFTAVLCRKNINVVSAIIIIFFQHIFEELAWLYLPDQQIANIPIYGISLWVCYRLWYDWVSKVLVVSTICSIAAESYWAVVGYTGPSITWYLGMMIVSTVIRHFIIYRVSYINSYFPEKGQSINLDWVLYKINAAVVVTQFFVLFEYFIRHILHFSDLLIAYNSSPYIIRALSTLIIWATFNESYKQLISRQLKA